MEKDANKTNSSFNVLTLKKRFQSKRKSLYYIWHFAVGKLDCCWFVGGSSINFHFGVHVLHILHYLFMMLINNGYIRNAKKRLFARSIFSDTIPYAIRLSGCFNIANDTGDKKDTNQVIVKHVGATLAFFWTTLTANRPKMICRVADGMKYKLWPFFCNSFFQYAFFNYYYYSLFNVFFLICNYSR